MTTQFLDRQSTLKQIEFFLPQIGETINFPAFLDSISDNFTANWDSKQYYGVQDSIGHFVGTSRKIDCSFKIMAQKEEESLDYQVQLNKLVQSLYPRFNSKTVPKSSKKVQSQSSKKVQTKFKVPKKFPKSSNP